MSETEATMADQAASPENVEENSSAMNSSGRLSLAPMDPQLKIIQPGGGVVIQMELFWGRIRRLYLKLFRRGYIERMKQKRKGDFNPCPFEVLDPRDLKFYRNQGGWYWEPEDDPFTWRNHLKFARVGLAELFVFSLITFGPACLLTWLLLGQQLQGGLALAGWLGVATFAVCGILIVWFFRNPHREIPQAAGVVVSPADGVIVAIDDLEHDEFVGGPAVMVGIFLSIFNVHINRSPIASRVIGLKYKEGKYLNALRPESARENEQLAVRIEGNEAPHRRMEIRQITGAIARRIVCWLKPGDDLDRGEEFGMIKLGSRTELVLPQEEAMEIKVKLGEKVKAGSTELVRYHE